MSISEHVGNSIFASDTGYDAVVDRFDISEADEGFVTIVAEVQAVRWQELVDIADFPEDTTEVPSEVLDAFMKSLARTYGADDCDIEEEDVLDGEPFDAYLTFAWALDVGADVSLDDAMEKVLGKVAQPAGPYGMHNALNGGFRSRNFYTDVVSAFHAARVAFDGRPRTLTVHFAHPHIQPIVIEDCEPEFADGSGAYELPSHARHDLLVEAMVAQSEGLLFAEWDEGIDSCVMFDLDLKQFTIWTGSGDNRGRGFRLYPETPLPYIERIEVT